jgi:hypothetical protein
MSGKDNITMAASPFHREGANAENGLTINHQSQQQQEMGHTSVR